MRGLRISLCLLAVLLGQTLQAQDDQFNLQLGVKGGVQLTEMSFNHDALDQSNRAGFSIGPSLRFKTPVMGLTVDVAALYDERDLKVNGEKLKQKSVLVPANARLGASVFNLLGIFIFAGPQFSFNVGDDLLQWYDDQGEVNQFALQNTTLSLNFGLGVTLGRHLEGTACYNLPLGKTGDFTWSELKNSLDGQSLSRAKSTVDAWRISVTYYF